MNDGGGAAGTRIVFCQEPPVLSASVAAAGTCEIVQSVALLVVALPAAL